MATRSMRGRGAPAARSRPWLSEMVQRQEAVLRGLRFIYRNSLEGDNFEDWGGDYLWCFHCVASTSADARLRALAREMGATLALKWRGEQQALPELADAGEVGYYMSMIDVSSRLGIDNHGLGEHVRQGSHRFTARDYLGFDPVREAPPGGARSRYDVWCDALVLTYTGDGCGIPMGASYVDVLRWLPRMRPYGGPADGEFRDMVLAITHLVYTLNDYNRYRLSPEWLPDEFEFLRENLKVPVAAGDAELLGEFVDCLRAFGLPDSDGVVRSGVEYLLASQNADGSWGDVDEPDVHTRYHTAWTAIDGLRDYAWSERTEWPAGVREVLVGGGWRDSHSIGPLPDGRGSDWSTGTCYDFLHDSHDSGNLAVGVRGFTPCPGPAAADRSRTVVRQSGDCRRADLAGWEISRVCEAVERYAQHLGQKGRGAVQRGAAIDYGSQAAGGRVRVDARRQVRRVREGQ